MTTYAPTSGAPTTGTTGHADGGDQSHLGVFQPGDVVEQIRAGVQGGPGDGRLRYLPGIDTDSLAHVVQVG